MLAGDRATRTAATQGFAGIIDEGGQHVFG